jgi:ABC-type proline/glycine betaine transport system permease subunit/ABC-type proline/glycine betaine transport system substrate-binding protein
MKERLWTSRVRIGATASIRSPFALLICLLALVCSVCIAPACSSSSPDAEAPGRSAPSVRPGTGDWLEERFQAEIVNIGLEMLGYKVEPIVAVSYPALYLSIASGEIDYAPISLQISHASFYANAGGDAKMDRVGSLFRISSGYQIDKKTADAHGITNLQRLQDPQIARLFDANADGKADLIGCDPGWGCELVLDHHMRAYNLQQTVSILKGQYTVLLADVITRYRQGKPVLYYTYEPFWLGSVLKRDIDVVWLEVPFTAYPESFGGITAEDTSVDGKNLGLLQDVYRVVGNRKFLEQNPVAKQFFDQVRIPVEDMIAISVMVNKEGKDKPQDMRQQAERWVEGHRALVNTWLDNARRAAANPQETTRVSATRQPASEGAGRTSALLNPFQLYTIPLAPWITSSIRFLVDHLRSLLQTISAPIIWVLRECNKLMLGSPPLLTLLVLVLLSWQLAGGRMALFSFAALTLIGFTGLWEQAMVSLSLVGTAVLFCILVGVPMGVACARSSRFASLLMPLLDVMQTLPTFVYLVPVVMLFGIGEVPGVIATIIYALPPLIRLTSVGINQVSQDVVEAAYAFGSTPMRTLWEVQLPLAMPVILTGINQTVLFGLGMSVVASMIAVPGLGLTVLQGMGRLDVGMAAVGGLAIVLLAIFLDRLTQSLGKSNWETFRNRGPVGIIFRLRGQKSS